MDLVHETTSPLAWDHEQMPFQLPSEAVAWKVRVFTGKPGRPPAVYGEQGILHLALDATVEDLRRAVANEAGSYRLYPVDMNGKEMTPIGCMEVVAQKQPVTALDVVQPDATATTAAMREMVVLCNRMVASRDSHDALLANVLNTLVSTTANIQRSTAAVLNAAGTTIKVANGVESLERQEPQLDVNQLTEQLVEALEPDEAPVKSGTPWYVQLLGSPVGMGILNNVNSFFSTLRENAVNKHTQEMPQPAPQPQPVQAPPVQAQPARPALPRAEMSARTGEEASQDRATRGDGVHVKKRPAKIDDDDREDPAGDDPYDEDRAVDLDRDEEECRELRDEELDGSGASVDQGDLESDDSEASGEASQSEVDPCAKRVETEPAEVYTGAKGIEAERNEFDSGIVRVMVEQVEADPRVERGMGNVGWSQVIAESGQVEPGGAPDGPTGREQDRAESESAPLASIGGADARGAESVPCAANQQAEVERPRLAETRQVVTEDEPVSQASAELPELALAEPVSVSVPRTANYTRPPWANDGERDGPAR